jgi:hypothetical protein
VQAFVTWLGGDMSEHLPGFAGVRAGSHDGLHGLARFAAADGLQGARYLGDILNAADTLTNFTGRRHEDLY